MAKRDITEEEIVENLQVIFHEKNRIIEELRTRVRTLQKEIFDLRCKDNDNESEPIDEAAKDITCYCSCHVGSANLKDASHASTQTFESDFTYTDSTGSALDWTVDSESGVTVADVLKKAVENQNPQSDYVFDEKFNMYYSPSTGYYYDTERNLLYEPYSQTYYTYDSEKNTYEVYYQVDNAPNEAEVAPDCTEQMSDGVNCLSLNDTKSMQNDCASKSRIRKNKKLAKRNAACYDEEGSVPSEDVSFNSSYLEDSKMVIDYSSPEEGEIVSDSSDSIILEKFDDPLHLHCSTVSQFNEDSCEKWPPCIRAIVKESKYLEVGNLILITCTGGIIGREQTSAVCIADVSVSKIHAEVTFNNDLWEYSIVDMGSQNGTFINDVRLSANTDKTDEQHLLHHGDILRLGSCKLLIHIHHGVNTCNECEPGLVQAELTALKETSSVFKSKAEREKERRQHLKQMKKKFGLESMDYVCSDKAFVKKSQEYEDRAQRRRVEKGSQNPFEKDVVASVDVSLPTSNKGYKMLKGMGWAEGQSLGASESGIIEPIAIKQQANKAGLGSIPALPKQPENPRSKNWRKAQKRFHELDK